MTESTNNTEKLEKLGRTVLNGIITAIPICMTFFHNAHEMYNRLPTDYLHFLIGAILCFFGGFYPTVFAAVQAAEHGGLTTVKIALKALGEEVIIIVNESKKDDKVDDDGDGTPDTEQLSPRILMERKVKLVLTKMNPEKVNTAISSIYKVWIAVLAVLKIEFARTVALAMTISAFFKRFVNRYIVPKVDSATPAEYKKWVPVLADWACKSIGVGIAWKIQTIITAFTSSLSGGLMMSRALIVILAKRGMGPKDHNDTTADEVASYVFAFLGFYFQFTQSFSAPFPFNIILAPVQLVENWIQWSVTD
eukprot:CAMPEP_0201687122 /NCGR_PEP_ID=MMETSP0578-20130828/1313_1 /ASSEMBLY_ACC=CAM_ASM_000663 /TAXON_ID=267565 /ORGANISM="Skeletonema grethea, Strain CCMP 1804" /LENGTH=306 /DNA_ID=CAMNT_0048171247 /DNA_START=107 /DNA_END=1030 /DNA_ORIENTATION=+